MDKNPKTRLVIEFISWIVGIIIGLIGIWQFIFPNVFNPHKTQQIDSTKNILTDSFNKRAIANPKKSSLSNNKNKESIANKNDLNNSNYYVSDSFLLKFNNNRPIFSFDSSFLKLIERHVTQEDIQRIINFLPSKESQIRIIYKRGDLESENYAKEIFDKLTSYNTLLIPSTFQPAGFIGDRFSLNSSFIMNDNSITISVNLFY